MFQYNILEQMQVIACSMKKKLNTMLETLAKEKIITTFFCFQSNYITFYYFASEKVHLQEVCFSDKTCFTTIILQKKYE